MPNRIELVIAAGLATACGAATTLGQCSGYTLEPGPGMLNGTVNALAMWDPDGAGPVSSTLVAAVGTRVFALDGGNWQQVGPTFGYGVSALTTFNGELIAASFFQPGSDWWTIVRWDGGMWVRYGDNRFLTGTRNFAVHNGQLFANGGAEFMRLDGTSWQRIGPFHGDSAIAVISYAGGLIGGGLVATSAQSEYYDAVRWDGAPGAWTGVGDSAGSYVEQFAIHNGRLIAAGDYRVRQWDGATWETLGNLGACDSAASYNGQLIVGGGFAGWVAGWDGTAWQTLGLGVGGTFPYVSRMAEWNGDLILGGKFTTANGQPAGSIARYRCIPCYANCDNSLNAPQLNANDFNCFLNKFAAGLSYANCDGSTSSPVLNANDFNCFMNAFAAGCP